MRKNIASLYLMIPLILFLGWVDMRDNVDVLIRKDAIEISIAVAISALLLTIGFLTERLVLSAKILKIGAILYIAYIVMRLAFDFGCSDFTWWVIPLGLFTAVFFCFPAFLTYSIAHDITKEANKAAHTNPLPVPSRNLNDNYEP